VDILIYSTEITLILIDNVDAIAQELNWFVTMILNKMRDIDYG